MIDNQGQHLMWGWIQEGRIREAQAAAGWSGVMSLPRQLSVRPDGLLGFAPVLQVQALRQKHHHFSQFHLNGSTAVSLPGVTGNCLELCAEVEADADAIIELILAMSPDRQELTRLLFDFRTRHLWLDRSQSSLDPAVERTPLQGTVAQSASRTTTLHIFLDHSVIEVFVNRQSCLTGRIYPTRADSLLIGLTTQQGHVQIHSLNIWEMGSAYTS